MSYGNDVLSSKFIVIAVQRRSRFKFPHVHDSEELRLWVVYHAINKRDQYRDGTIISVE